MASTTTINLYSATIPAGAGIPAGTLLRSDAVAVLDATAGTSNSLVLRYYIRLASSAEIDISRETFLDIRSFKSI